MAHVASDWEKDLERQIEEATAHLNQAIPVPTDGTEDDAVASVIHEYRQRTGVELDEPVVRAEVRRLRAEAADGTP
jgi:hypothetical protein